MNNLQVPKSPILPMGIKEIEKVIPHRYPFLLIDKVIDIELEKKITAIKCISFNEYFFQGHFPSRPLMPGVLSVEAMAQAAGVLTRLSFDPDYKVEALFFASIDNIRFRKPIEPGDTLYLEIELIKVRNGFYKYYGVAKVCNEVVSSADFLLTARI